MAMAVAFYSLLFGLSWGNLSLVVPASASLTFVANAVAARIFLHERVGRRRWIAALAGGGRRGADGAVIPSEARDEFTFEVQQCFPRIPRWEF
jgi:hypothetical protein